MLSFYVKFVQTGRRTTVNFDNMPPDLSIRGHKNDESKYKYMNQEIFNDNTNTFLLKDTLCLYIADRNRAG